MSAQPHTYEVGQRITYTHRWGYQGGLGGGTLHFVGTVVLVVGDEVLVRLGVGENTAEMRLQADNPNLKLAH